MKALLSILILLGVNQAQAAWLNCSFTGNQVVDVKTGKILARSLSPKVLQNARQLDVLADDKGIRISVAFSGADRDGIGYKGCADTGSGSDCYTVEQMVMPYRYLASFGANRATMTLSTSAMFGNRMEDLYDCR